MAVLAMVHLLAPGGWFGQASYLTVTVGAAAVAWLGVLRFGRSNRVWLAAGITAAALGEVLFRVVAQVDGAEPDLSIADLAWIASYVGVGVAMLQLLRRGHLRLRRDVDGLIDASVLTLVAVLLLWQFWLDAIITDPAVPLGTRVVWASYPILDAILLALVIRTVVGRRARQAMGPFVIVGVACWLVADFTTLIAAPEGFGGAVLDVGWMVGAALLALGCWRVPEAEVDPDEVDADHVQEQIGPGRIGLALAPLLLPGLIELISHGQGEDANPVPLLAATVAFGALAGARAMRLLNVRNQALERLASSERLYRALSANSSDAVLVLDAEGVITNDAPNLVNLLGYERGQTRGARALDFVSATDVDASRLLDHALQAPGVVISGEALITRADDSEVWLSTRAVNLLDEPDVGGIVVNLHDITARKYAQRLLVHQAFHDPLTGLANRALFRDRVEHALTRRVRTGFDPAVIYLDLDGFKNVNDGLGHEAGDNLLREVADRLQGIVRSGDTVARLGGDEFAVLVEESSGTLIEAEAIADRALHVLTAPVMLGDHVVTLSASLGIANGHAESTASSLLRDADVAMYQAKSTGKARWVIYQPTMRVAAVERLRLESDLIHAMARAELALVYQPVIELATSRIVGFEALLRWEHPQLGTIMPDVFIPLAEDNGTIVPIGRWVLQTACQTAARWRDRATGDLTMGVNLSARQLASADLVRDVVDSLAAAGLAANALVLEMTETVLIQDVAIAATRLGQLRDLGVRLAIDDFGAGYSSLGYLRQFPVDILKVDGSFINAITDRETVPPLVRGLLELGRTLQLEIVAEGIESDVQLSQLRDQHCEFGQGFLFARPLAPEAAELLLSEPSLRPP